MGYNKRFASLQWLEVPSLEKLVDQYNGRWDAPVIFLGDCTVHNLKQMTVPAL